MLTLVGLFVLLTVVSRGRSRLLNRRWQAAEQEGHRHAKQRLREVLETVPGAELVVVQRVVSASLRGTRAVVLWTATATVQEVWFPRAGLRNGDRLAIAGADPSTGQVDVKNVLTRAAADPVAES
ncbi:MAG: hypothetical protein ACRDR6_13360 [Pseudonocardiaceae bacterium]